MYISIGKLFPVQSVEECIGFFTYRCWTPSIDSLPGDLWVWVILIISELNFSKCIRL